MCHEEYFAHSKLPIIILFFFFFLLLGVADQRRASLLFTDQVVMFKAVVSNFSVL